jgi:hypothetical protein
MNTTNGTDGAKRGIGSLRELSRDVAPPRDLWPSISAQLGNQASPPLAAGGGSWLRPTGLQWAALAAVVSALAVGVLLGRGVLSTGGAGQAPGGQSSVNVAANGTSTNPGGPASPATGAANGAANVPAGAEANPPVNGAPTIGMPVLAAAYVTDPRYTMQHATMVRELEAQMKTLPLESQQKVAASLTTIRDSMKDIEAAMGRDPANALLQELLVNTYQDEMRVLTAVNEASDAGGGI